MFAEPSARTQDLLDRMRAFFDAHIYPNEARLHDELHRRRRNDTQWEPLDVIEELKPKGPRRRPVEPVPAAQPPCARRPE